MVLIYNKFILNDRERLESESELGRVLYYII